MTLGRRNVCRSGGGRTDIQPPFRRVVADWLEEPMPERHSSAVVIGASIGGLLAARVLSDHFAHVTIVERDPLPDGQPLRKGVPQAAHAHGLLATGYRVIDRYFPGLMDEFSAIGAPCGDIVG